MAYLWWKQLIITAYCNKPVFDVQPGHVKRSFCRPRQLRVWQRSCAEVGCVGQKKTGYCNPRHKTFHSVDYILHTGVWEGMTKKTHINLSIYLFYTFTFDHQSFMVTPCRISEVFFPALTPWRISCLSSLLILFRMSAPFLPWSHLVEYQKNVFKFSSLSSMITPCKISVFVTLLITGYLEFFFFF